MDETPLLENLLVARVVRFNAIVQGIVTGLLLGLSIFVATIWLILKGGPVIGPHLALLGQFLIGYRVTLLGSFVGLAYGCVIGFGIGFFVTTMYNRIATLRERPNRKQL
jgi:hypothetical protein